jgi:hypothetical protein
VVRILQEATRGAAPELRPWRVTDRDDDYYAKLQRASGETHRLLPVPAYFIVDTAGLIWFEYVNPNYRVRPPFELMLTGVQAVITMWNTKVE